MPIMKNWNGYEIYDEVARTKLEELEEHTHSLQDLEVANGNNGAQTIAAFADMIAVESLIGGTAITENADLDSYTTVGNYYSSGSTRTGTLRNKPDGLTDGFQLKVRYVYGNYVSETSYISQEITSNNGSRYTRGMAENSWGGWRKVYTTSDTIAVEDGGTGANNSVDALHNLGIHWGTDEAEAYWSKIENGDTMKKNTIYIQINS